jgi:hypothetical protein
MIFVWARSWAPLAVKARIELGTLWLVSHWLYKVRYRASPHPLHTPHFLKKTSLKVIARATPCVVIKQKTLKTTRPERVWFQIHILMLLSECGRCRLLTTKFNIQYSIQYFFIAILNTSKTMEFSFGRNSMQNVNILSKTCLSSFSIIHFCNKWTDKWTDKQFLVLVHT